MSALLAGAGALSVFGNILQAAETDSLKEQLAAAYAQNAQLSEANVAFYRQNQELQQRVQGLTGDLHGARSQATRFQKDFEREKGAHAETQKKAKADVTKLNGDLQQEKAAHVQTRQQAQAALAQSQAHATSLRGDVDVKDAENKNLAQRIQQLTADLAQARADVKRLGDELVRETTAHAETTVLTEKAQDEAAQAKAENATLLGKLEARTKEIDILKAKLEEQKAA